MNKKRRIFTSRSDLEECINSYFKYIEGHYELALSPSKTKNEVERIAQKVWLREPEPPTISGLTYYLGFESRQAFDHYEMSGRFGPELKRGRLRIETEYEKKLHQSSSTGAMFALKAMGWHEKADTLPMRNGTITIQIIDTGILPAASEQEVDL
jgi:DNA-packaging protein gp3